MKRRALLSVSAATLFGGCLRRGESQPQPRLAWIWLQNDRTEAYNVDITVVADGEPMFADTYQVGTTPETASITVDDPVDKPREYIVQATMDGKTREVEIAEFADGDENCVGVRFLLLDNGNVTYSMKSMQQC
ncbi:hypothetical protein ACFQJ7_01170 [Halovenus rubra]|uniref:Uncharacterized protein n=2 Tax=Halovenus rubra TaxID=869890 RepID=A0ACC7E089_9EURY|nr:hypothetical protein [Halovenus rubra]